MQDTPHGKTPTRPALLPKTCQQRARILSARSVNTPPPPLAERGHRALGSALASSRMLVVGLWHVALAPCAPTRVGRVRQPPTMVADPTARLPRVPQSPEEMVEHAARAVARGAAAGALRQTVRVVVPDDKRAYKVFGAVEIQGTSAPEDLDPWPGGLLQQYPIALDLGRRLLAGDTAGIHRRYSGDIA